MNRNRITAIIFFILLIVSCSGIAAASGIREMISFFGNGETFGYEITTQAVKLQQFDENRTETLNRLLRHFSFSGRLDAREATLTVSMDGQKLFALSETEVGGTTTAALETDSNSFVIIPEDENEEKNGVFTGCTAAVSENLSLYTALEEYAAFFAGLPDLYPEMSGYGRILEKYKDYGTAVKKVSLRFSAEDWAECVRKYAPDIPEGSILPALRKMVFVGKQDVELLMTEEGTLLKVRYGGNAGISEEDIRVVRLEWKTVRNETVGRDELTLRTPDSSAAKRNNLILDHLWRKTQDGSETFSWKAESDVVADGVRTRAICECSMESADGKTGGSWAQTTTVKNGSVTEEFLFESDGCPENGYTGTLEIISKKDKIDCVRLKADFRLTANVQAQAGDIIPEPEAVSKEEFDVIRGNLVRRILVGLMSLPPEDLVFVTEGIPDETLNLILPDHEQ